MSENKTADTKYSDVVQTLCTPVTQHSGPEQEGRVGGQPELHVDSSLKKRGSGVIALL